MFTAHKTVIVMLVFKSPQNQLTWFAVKRFPKVTLGDVQPPVES